MKTVLKGLLTFILSVIASVYILYMLALLILGLSSLWLLGAALGFSYNPLSFGEMVPLFIMLVASLLFLVHILRSFFFTD